MAASQTERPHTPRDGGKPSRNPKKRRYKRAGLFAHLILSFAVLSIFGSMLQSPVLWSEFDVVERSSYESIERWQDAWSLDAIRRENPLSVTSYFFEKSIPLTPAVTHRLTNLLLHLSAVFLLLRVLESLKLRGAYTATFIFAIHPALIQTLFIWGYRHEIFGLIFILLALLYGIRLRNPLDYSLAMIFTALASAFHPSGIAIPIILGLVVYLKKHSLRARHLNAVFPLLCVGILASVWTHSIQYPAELPTALTTTSEWSAHAGQSFFFYLGRALGTGTPALFYPYDFSSLQSQSLEASLLPFCILLPFYALALFQLRKRWSRGLIFGLTSFLALLFPALFGFGHNFDGLLVYEEHHLYVALPALLILIVVGSRHLVAKLEFAARSLWYIAIGLILIIEVLTSVSWSYTLGQPAEMWRLQAEQWPDSWRPKVAQMEYVLTSETTGSELQDAIVILEKTLELNPDLFDQRALLARSYVRAGQKNNALREYRILIRDKRVDLSLIQETADFMEQFGLTREARETRKRIQIRQATETSN